jgi:hypothetical protein
MRGSRRSSLGRVAVATGALACALLAMPGGAGAANPPACDPSVYPIPFLVIDGSNFVRNTRFLELRQNPSSTRSTKGDADPEYPFPLRVDRTRHPTRTFTVHDYAREQFPVVFFRPETAVARATYVEDHTEYPVTGFSAITVHVRCTRTLTKTFKAPPKQRRPGGGGGGGGGGGDDGED